MASDFNYATKIDIHVRNEAGEEFYIPGVVGDIKRHSGPEGLYQTGIEIPSGEYLPDYADGSTVEFLGNNIVIDETGRYVVNITNEYELIGVIVYDGVLNYEPNEGID